MAQGTIKDFDDDTRAGTLLMDDASEIRIDATSLEGAGERRAIRSLLRQRRAAYVGAIAGATAAAGAAGIIVLASRARHRKLRLAG